MGGIRALIGKPGTGHAWQTITKAQMRRLEPGTSLAITTGPSTVYTCWRPPRHRGESPVAYYKRTKVVDDNYMRGHKGRYYCNPAHCSRSWKSKAERDEHLGCAHAILS
jgi:hypothetical protein